MKRIHLIANAHLDPVWLWRWEEGCTEALSTFRTAVELIDKYPNFVFNHNEALLYDWVEQNDPELFSDIKRCVDCGRWNIMSGWYLQPDCNMPNGESIVRNITVGRKYFDEKFQKRPTTAINFDSFGHSKGLVQIMKQAGYDSYVVMRGGQSHRFKEHDFIWQGLNGDEIITHRSDEGYNSIYGHAADKLEDFFKKNPDEELSFFLWGVGDHGGGPSKEDLDKLAVLSEQQKDSYEILHSTPEKYIAELKTKNPQMPKTDEGLNPVAEGCYTSQIRVKFKHRQLESEFYSAERMLSAAASQYNFTYPQNKMDEVEKDILFSEFHDALPGSGSTLVEDDTLRLLDHGLEIISREKMRAFLALTAGQDRVIDGTSTFFIYNHHPFTVEGEFECEMGLPKQNWEHNFMYPSVKVNGAEIPTQYEKEYSNFGLDWRKRVVVSAKLEPSSVNRFDVFWKPIEKRPTFESISDKPEFIFDNGEMRVVINTRTGLVDSYSVGDKQLLNENSFTLAAYDDTCNPWGMKRGGCRRVFNLLTPHEGSEFSGIQYVVAPSVCVIDDGEVRTVVEVVSGMYSSKAYTRYFLPKKGTSFETEIGVDWGEKENYLKLELNVAENDIFSGQIMFGREPLKKQNREVVFQKWVMVGCDSAALGVINNGIHGGSLDNNILGMTLLRSAAHTSSADNTGPAMREIRYAPRMDQGMHIYKFKLDGADYGALSSKIDSEAIAFNEPPYALAHIPSGKGKAPVPLVKIADSSVILSCFKPAKDGKGYILRFYEPEGRAQSCSVTLFSGEISEKIDFAPFEIKTFRLDGKELAPETITEGY